jgi:ubiquinone/menaquinone biosynthesis C-methylase UbiE
MAQQEKSEGPMLTSDDARRFYNTTGWVVTDQGTVDKQLFGDRDPGSIQRAMFQARMARMRDALQLAGQRLQLLEVGCGGNPEVNFLDLCSTYTGADFSSRGLQVAESRLRDRGVPFKLIETPADRLPFADNTFDAVYSAHMLYHIPVIEEQGRAFRETARVVRPGGVVVLIVANPRPLLFPVRLLRRAMADNYYVSRMVNRLRRTPLLPVLAMPIRWMTRQLAPFGQVSVSCHQIASAWRAQHLSENHAFGRAIWSFEAYLERKNSPLIPHLGNYIQITLRKHGSSESAR